jgi:hypothetical protein
MPDPDPMISLTITAGVFLLFGVALVHKLRDWLRFRETLANYRLFPRVLAPAAAALVVVLEAIIVVGCLLPAARRMALVLACGMLLAYAAALTINLARGRILVDCGCGGFAQRQPIAWWMVRRNMLLAAFALLGSLPAAPRVLSAADGLVIVLATVAAAGLYAAHAALADSRRHFSR